MVEKLFYKKTRACLQIQKKVESIPVFSIQEMLVFQLYFICSFNGLADPVNSVAGLPVPIFWKNSQKVNNHIA